MSHSHSSVHFSSIEQNQIQSEDEIRLSQAQDFLISCKYTELDKLLNKVEAFDEEVYEIRKHKFLIENLINVIERMNAPADSDHKIVGHTDLDIISIFITEINKAISAQVEFMAANKGDDRITANKILRLHMLKDIFEELKTKDNQKAEEYININPILGKLSLDRINAILELINPIIKAYKEVSIENILNAIDALPTHYELIANNIPGFQVVNINKEALKKISKADLEMMLEAINNKKLKKLLKTTTDKLSSAKETKIEKIINDIKDPKDRASIVKCISLLIKKGLIRELPSEKFERIKDKTINQKIIEVIASEEKKLKNDIEFQRRNQILEELKIKDDEYVGKTRVRLALSQLDEKNKLSLLDELSLIGKLINVTVENILEDESVEKIVNIINSLPKKMSLMGSIKEQLKMKEYFSFLNLLKSNDPTRLIHLLYNAKSKIITNITSAYERNLPSVLNKINKKLASDYQANIGNARSIVNDILTSLNDFNKENIILIESKFQVLSQELLQGLQCKLTALVQQFGLTDDKVMGRIIEANKEDLHWLQSEVNELENLKKNIDFNKITGEVGARKERIKRIINDLNQAFEKHGLKEIQFGSDELKQLLNVFNRMNELTSHSLPAFVDSYVDYQINLQKEITVELNSLFKQLKDIKHPNHKLSDYDRMKKMLKDNKKLIVDLKDELQDLPRLLLTLNKKEAKFTLLKSELKSLEEQNNQIDEQNKKIDEQNNQIEEQNKKVEKQCKKLRRQLKQQKKELVEMREKLDALKEQSKLEINIVHNKEFFAMHIYHHELGIENKEQEIAKTKARLKKTKATKTQLKAKVEKIKDKIEEIDLDHKAKRIEITIRHIKEIVKLLDKINYQLFINNFETINFNINNFQDFVYVEFVSVMEMTNAINMVDDLSEVLKKGKEITRFLNSIEDNESSPALLFKGIPQKRLIGALKNCHQLLSKKQAAFNQIINFIRDTFQDNVLPLNIKNIDDDLKKIAQLYRDTKQDPKKLDKQIEERKKGLSPDEINEINMLLDYKLDSKETGIYEIGLVSISTKLYSQTKQDYLVDIATVISEELIKNADKVLKVLIMNNELFSNPTKFEKVKKEKEKNPNEEKTKDKKLRKRKTEYHGKDNQTNIPPVVKKSHSANLSEVTITVDDSNKENKKINKPKLKKQSANINIAQLNLTGDKMYALYTDDKAPSSHSKNFLMRAKSKTKDKDSEIKDQEMELAQEFFPNLRLNDETPPKTKLGRGKSKDITLHSSDETKRKSKLIKAISKDIPNLHKSDEAHQLSKLKSKNTKRRSLQEKSFYSPRDAKFKKNEESGLAKSNPVELLPLSPKSEMVTSSPINPVKKSSNSTSPFFIKKVLPLPKSDSNLEGFSGINSELISPKKTPPRSDSRSPVILKKKFRSASSASISVTNSPIGQKQYQNIQLSEPEIKKINEDDITQAIPYKSSPFLFSSLKKKASVITNVFKSEPDIQKHVTIVDVEKDNDSLTEGSSPSTESSLILKTDSAPILQLKEQESVFPVIGKNANSFFAQPKVIHEESKTTSESENALEDVSSSLEQKETKHNI